MKCEVDPKDKSGRIGVKVEAVTSVAIEPALPRVVSLKIIGAPYHNTKFRSIMQYYGILIFSNIFDSWKVAKKEKVYFCGSKCRTKNLKKKTGYL
jgi:hypothetical protein